MNFRKLVHSLCIVCFLLLFAQQGSAESKAPIIKHRPITDAAMNQSLNFRAQVISTSAPLESVTLYFTTSTDSAPVKIPMKPLDGNLWSGTIPAGFIAGFRSINYYIEAITDHGLLTETTWYRVNILSVDQPAAAAPAAFNDSRSMADSGDKTWVKPALIAGGAVAVAGGAVLLLAGGGGGGGGGSDDPVTNAAGTYAGTATTCYATSTNTACETDMIAITITEDGYATSDTLCSGEFMRSPVRGDEFTMMAEQETGQIIYSGTIVNDKIVGSISGSGTTSAGSGSYSGTFNATRQ